MPLRILIQRFAQSHALLRPTIVAQTALPHRFAHSRRRGAATEDRFKPDEETSLLHIDERFKSVPKENRNKATFLEVIELFKRQSRNGRGQVEFVTSALQYMKEYNLHKDLDIYRALLDIFPKGPLRYKNRWQAISFYYPHQQAAALKVLDEMEWQMVYPDKQIFEIAKETFGAWAMVTKKTRRMFYWMPKLRYSNKYLDRKLLDHRHADIDFLERARMALVMMSRDKGAQITYTKTSNDNSMIISAQSPLQRRLIRSYNPSTTCYYVNGPFLVYVAENVVKYVTFTTDPGPNSERLLDRFIGHKELEDIDKIKFYEGPFDPPPEGGTIHEQIDQTILALGVLEDNTENSASAWVSHLQNLSPILKKSTVILRIKNED